jgi:hypothetical protein
VGHGLRRIDRGVRVLAALGLLAALAISLVTVHRFGQERFFTIDEYQYGHATWLVSEGRRPYADFYEHHFPLSYVLHSPLLLGDGSFRERALRLRLVPFGYLALLCAVLGVAGYGVTRNVHAALLSALAPLAVGFGLMSAVDYRADNFAACLFMACLALLEANRRWNRRGVALLCGLLFMVAVFMTQKMVVVGGGTFAVFAALDFARRRRARGAAAPAPFVRHPVPFAASAAAVFVAVIGAGALLGMLPAAWEATILHAFQHELHYPAASSALGDYVAPFWQATRWSTAPILLFAALFFGIGRNGFWAVAIVVSATAAARAKAQYPYDYVFVCYAVALCAMRGYSLVVERLRFEGRLGEAIRPLLYLAPLLLLPDQVDFLSRGSTNEQQMNMMQKIEAFSSRDDVVIDGAGGAMFRNHASYYWYHGDAHRVMFADYFRRDLVEDYRRSKALFWIIDFRLKKLPRPVHSFQRRHYVQADRGLFTLGFVTPATSGASQRFEIDVIRAGDYYVHPQPAAAGEESRNIEPADRGGLLIEGRHVSGGSLRLDEKRYLVEVLPHTPRMILSLLPPEAFERRVFGDLPYSPLFRYDEPDPGS